MKMYESAQSVEKYLNVELECSCGRTHFAPIKAMRIGQDAINSLPEYMKQFGYSKPYILCDKITYQVAGEKCKTLLTDAGYEVSVLIIKHLGFDEACLGEIVINKPDDCDVMIGCGTGSITDMTRYSSFKLGLPCFTVCTGAPMDGFSASVGIMNIDNIKVTTSARSTELIIGDTEILASAPHRMTIAGFDDLIGKLSALTDWRIAALANEDHYCKSIDDLVSVYVQRIMNLADELKERRPEAVGEVMNALLLTGATISLYGNSRPISGAEHHISHYWDAIGDQQGKAFAMHGEQVAVGTVLVLMFNERLRSMDINFDAARSIAAEYDPQHWAQEIRRVYGAAAEAIIRLEEQSGKNCTADRLARIDRIESQWESIKMHLNQAYPSASLRALLKKLGSPCDPKDIGITPELLRDSLIYCKETRARYTVLQMAWDLGLIETITDDIIAALVQMQAV